MNEKTPMKLTKLLQARAGLSQRLALANMAFGYQLLSEFTQRIRLADLRGVVNLKSPEANDEQNWASLTALEGSQSRIEEHFTEEDLMDLVDAIRYVTGDEIVVDLTFRIEDLGDMFLEPLGQLLEESGIEIDLAAPRAGDATSSSGSTAASTGSDNEPPDNGRDWLGR